MSRSSARAAQAAALIQVVPATRAGELDEAYAADCWEAERLGCRPAEAAIGRASLESPSRG